MLIVLKWKLFFFIYFMENILPNKIYTLVMVLIGKTVRFIASPGKKCMLE